MFWNKKLKEQFETHQLVKDEIHKLVKELKRNGIKDMFDEKHLVNDSDIIGVLSLLIYLISEGEWE